MEQLVGVLSRYATSEVITVITTLSLAWAGWRIAAKGLGLVSVFAAKFSFLALTTAVMFIAGLGVAGLGTGDLIARISNPQNQILNPSKNSGMSDYDLRRLANDAINDQAVSRVLDYVSLRDNSRDPLLEVIAKVESPDKQAELLLEYMRVRKQNEGTKAESLASISDPFVEVGYEQNKTEIVSEKTDQPTFSIQVAFALLSLGIAACFVSISGWLDLNKK